MFSALTIPAAALNDNNEADWITAAVSSSDQNELFHLLFADWSETSCSVENPFFNVQQILIFPFPPFLCRFELGGACWRASIGILLKWKLWNWWEVTCGKMFYFSYFLWFYFVNSNPVGTCKRENAAGGEWKLPSQPIGMGDRTKEAGAKQFRIEILDLAEFYNWTGREDSGERSPERRTHSPNICKSLKLKLILSYLMSFSLMTKLIWAVIAFVTTK